jgi:hypothetical protein
MYEPLKVFTYIGLVLFGLGLVPAVRFLYLHLTDYTGGGRFVPSLIASAILMIIGFQVLLIGLLADVISANRKLLEEVVYRVRSLELSRQPADGEPVAPGGRRDGRWES